MSYSIIFYSFCSVLLLLLTDTVMLMNSFEFKATTKLKDGRQDEQHKVPGIQYHALNRIYGKP